MYSENFEDNVLIRKEGILLDFCYCLYQATIAEGGRLVLLSEISKQSHQLHDIDIVLDGLAWKRRVRIIKRLESLLNWKLVQHIQYDLGDSEYYVIGYLGLENEDPIFVKFDFLHDETGLGRYGVKTNLLLNNIEIISGLPYPSPERLLSYLLQKRLSKGEIDSEQFARLVMLRKRVRTEFDQTLVTKHYPSAVTTHAYKLLRDNDLNSFKALIAGQIARSENLFQALMLNSLRVWLQAVRVFRRVTYPVGRMILISVSANGDRSEVEAFKRIFDIPFRGRVLITSLAPNRLDRFRLIITGWLILVVQQNEKIAPIISPLMLYEELAAAANLRLSKKP